MILLVFLVRGLTGKSWRQIILALLWIGVAIWFFNSPFWGFSRISWTRQGISIEYGFLSFFKNEKLTVCPEWSIKSGWQGFPRSKELYWLQIEKHRSMKVERGGRALLEHIGARLDDYARD